MSSGSASGEFENGDVFIQHYLNGKPFEGV